MRVQSIDWYYGRAEAMRDDIKSVIVRSEDALRSAERLVEQEEHIVSLCDLVCAMTLAQGLRVMCLEHELEHAYMLLADDVVDFGGTGRRS